MRGRSPPRAPPLACRRGPRRALLLPDLRGGLRHHGHRRRRAGRAGARRRRASGVARLHVLARAAASPPGTTTRGGSTGPGCAVVDVGWDDALDDLAAASATSSTRRARRRRPLPRHRHGLRRRRAGRVGRGWRRSGAARSTPRPPSTTRRCWWPPSWWPATPCSARCGTPTCAGPAAAGRHQPGGLPRLRHDDPRPGPPPARPPAPGRPAVGHRPAPHRDGGAGRRAPGGAARRRRRGAGRAGPAPPRPTGHDADELDRCCDPADVDALRGSRSRPFTVARAAGGGRGRREAHRPPVADVRAHRGRVGRLCGTGDDHVRRRHPRRVAALGAADPHRLARPAGRDALPGRAARAGCARPARRPRRPTAARPGRPAGPSCARVIGQVPAVALADEIEAGHVRALVVTGGNPIGALPEPDRMRARPGLARRAGRGRRGRERAHRRWPPMCCPPPASSSGPT